MSNLFLPPTEEDIRIRQAKRLEDCRQNHVKQYVNHYRNFFQPSIIMEDVQVERCNDCRIEWTIHTLTERHTYRVLGNRTSHRELGSYHTYGGAR